jgi:uncharacterized tellurite resistance protein B-like protein
MRFAVALSAFSNIKRLFGGSRVSEAEQKELFKEALLLALSRAADADSSVRAVEVDAIRLIIEREIGETVDAADVRVAAKSELYEKAPLTVYLSQVSRSLSSEQRSAIARCLREVMRSDRETTVHEVDFFNQVVSALNATPAEIAGLTAN